MSDEIEKIGNLQRDYIHIFESDEGKRVLEDLKKRCFVNQTTFVNDSHATAFHEGHRSVVLHILTMLSLDIAKLKEQQEAQEKQVA